MVYVDKIYEADKKAINHQFATKILYLMDDLRLNANEKNSRRWIWELLQNAKDVSYENNKVSVRINLDKTKKILEFSHNGKPFTSENITFLLKQVSTKERTKNGENKETGKFGTGFLTTHLLSEIVVINGILKEPDEPYKQVEIKLDRSGRDIDTIIKSVEASFSQLKKIDTSPSVEDFNPNKLNTVFTYDLDERGIEIAEQGLEDLLNNIIFTLTLLPEIKSIYIENLNTKFELEREVIKLSENIAINTVIEQTGDKRNEYKILTIAKHNVTLALQIEEIQNKIFIKEIKNTIPKLFCHFPLIGTESFPFPFIINSPYFNPTDPRNGVYLKDSNEEKIIENVTIMSIALELYCDLLNYASKHNWGKMYLFASSINSSIHEDWLSNEWLKKNITDPIKNKLLNTPIVDTLKGDRISILDEIGKTKVWFPSHNNLKIRSKIWEISSCWIPEKLPVQEEIDNWYQVMWSDKYNLTLKVLTSSLQERKNIDYLASELIDIAAFDWINLYFEILNEEGKFINEIIGDKFAVIPNQKGHFKKRTELNYDEEIDEELKNVLDILGEDYRERLLNRKIHVGDQILLSSKNQKDAINKINEIISYDINLEACFYTVSLFNFEDEFPKIRNDIYDFSKDIFKDKIHDKSEILNWSLDIWENIDKIVIEYLVNEISNYKNIETLSEVLNTDQISTLKWLNNFVSFLNENQYDYHVNNGDKPILPNQNGVFHIKDNLFLDDGTTEDFLKDILRELGLDIRENLLSKEIFLKLPENRTKNQTNIAEDITKLIIELNRDASEDEDIKQVHKKILIWFKDNQDLAKELFPELYKNKHKLYDDTEIAESMEKAIKYDEIMDKYDIQDFNSLERILEVKLSQIEENQEYKQNLTEEILIQLGIFSQTELDAAFSNKLFSDNFIHLSEKDRIKFEFVQKIINRSIKKVFEHLETKSEYDVSDPEEISKTIFSVTKNGEDIYLIIRPADYDQVIIYYDSEKDILDYEKDCELWIADEKSPPQKITFGKMLKITGLNRIPLKKII
ncbi:MULTISPECIES: ATP-binding protein [Lysinibacillus]|uniref:ATP-binding protein n=1 Tax=Lysinibacillus fusiformis TaxID=28031 RepID=A0A2I0UYU7_9BACI|nr:MULTISPECIES: ATP-binding protein [Lysinibacillus]PKU51245.1 hypothetical protein CRI88_10975 [Lysinibacillus fusiformis]SCY07895.1 hypothetical protein SAMN02787078_00733 [Lysinibacillus sp. SG9]SDB13524.1 hypothetical protein SAMN02787079_01039 [Lysinibacillus sp. TC-37]SFS51969.1 hypothetical protein SAMN02787087_01042 [Lysinibacillus sp. SG55]